MPIISVIVPVYKVEAYLDRCVQSILQQTYTDFELILVDDGSPDRCGELCDGWAERDSRIKVIHKENGGLSDARNAGIDWAFDHSDSQWIFFADSDDFLHSETLERLLNAAEAFCADISIGGYAETSGEPLKAEKDDLRPELWKSRDYFIQKNVNAIVAWGKLYRKSLFAEIRYPVGKIHEDEYTTYKLLFACEDVAVVSAPLYGYYANPEGITKSRWSPKRLDALVAFQERIRFFKAKKDKELVAFTVRTYAVMIAHHFGLAKDYPVQRKRLCRKLGALLLRYPRCFRLKEDYWIFNRVFPKITHCLRSLIVKIKGLMK